MSAISLRAAALSTSSLVDTAYTTTAGIVGLVAANVNTPTTAFGRSEGVSPPVIGASKGETFAEQRSRGNGGGGSDGGDDGGDDVDAVEFVLQQRIRLFDILGDIDNRKDKVKLSRKDINELTVQGLEVCYIVTERARKDKAVLAELISTYPKRVSETSINNPAILVVHGEFNVSDAQLSIYANILQRAHDGIDGIGRPMTTGELGAALRKTLMGFYRKHCLQSDGTAKRKAVQNEPFTFDGPFRTTAFDGLDGIFIVRLAVNNGVAEAQKFGLETPVVEGSLADYEETAADDANSPPAATSPPSTAHATTPPAALDHDGIVRQELAAIFRAGTAQNYNAIASSLNAAGITTARGNNWYAGTLKNALERWGYSSVAEFVAAHADDTVVATVPNGDDEPPPATAAPVPTVPDDDANPEAATDMVVISNPATKSALIAILQVVSAIGYQAVRVEAGRNEWKVWATDGINKSVFMSGGCNIIEPINVNFALSKIAGLLSALNASSEKIIFEFDDVRVFKKIDPSDDNSKTIEVIERQLVKLKIGRYVHAVDHVSSALKAQLKKTPAWTITATIDLKNSGIVDFAKYVNGVRSVDDKFTATLNDGGLEFSINYDYKHSAVIPICPCEFTANSSNHGWKIVQFKKLLKGIAALKVQTINLFIDAATGLLMIEVNKKVGQNETVNLQVILPGKIAD